MGYFLLQSLTLRSRATHTYRSDVGYSLVLGLRANHSTAGQARSHRFTLSLKSFCPELIMLEDV